MKIFKFKVNDEVKEFEFTKNDFNEFIEEINKTFHLQIKGFSYKDDVGDEFAVISKGVWKSVPNDKKIEIEFILEKKQEENKEKILFKGKEIVLQKVLVKTNYSE